MWSQGSYFLYLYMVLLQHYFHSEKHCFLLEQTLFNVLKAYQTDWVESSTQFRLAIQNYCSIDNTVLCHPYFISVMSQLSSITIINFILAVKPGSQIFLVAMSANCRPPSHQSILYILHFSPFLTKYILHEIYLVCLLYLPLLAIHIEDLLYNTTRGAFSWTIHGSLFNNLWIKILKCAKAIPSVHAAL